VTVVPFPPPRRPSEALARHARRQVDRAGFVEATIAGIYVRALRGRLNGADPAILPAARDEVADLLVDEFFDIAQMTLTEIRLEDG
jgi:hypothetical protein